ncbi:NAD(P)H-hydrate dehydratase [Phormidium sp. CCY1219]|uniref:NAD(P)H-hydrate dehydratase n=1 Tax=Phormidium sp. CCY1219 TaxID=2886104 RepID=UPI002D1F6A0C|nr:NAD(P)H-hydrate dehydratase [Phormidium sp. CCY1219]MEB3831045.1 NAD(P)H-hydrate dehydratase [Phormidium sp. CCY1219]
MKPVEERQKKIQQFIVNAEQMSAIEGRLFDAGMPVAALMEKAAGLVAQRIHALYPPEKASRVGVLVGPGHNGGDGLVVARELHFKGYEVTIYRPLSKCKELTGKHAEYVASLGIRFSDNIEWLETCDVVVDGLFGFGLERPLEGAIADAVNQLVRWNKLIVSIDMPSGLHTDTGEVLGTAVRATHTLCLGLWKLGLLQDKALDYVGEAELIDFGIPLADIEAVLTDRPSLGRITPERAIAHLPLSRASSTHKYKQGHLLLFCGSRRYTGAAILCGLGARASGVGMLSIAVPESLKPYMSDRLADAIVIGCPETDSGAIAQLPDSVDLGSFDAIGGGCGLTRDAESVVKAAIESDRPLILDADGLNILAQMNAIAALSPRQSFTLLTPHPGEFKRLFPDIAQAETQAASAARAASSQSGAVVLLKGARTAIAHPDGSLEINPQSTPALARGGSGDVLTGLASGLIAQAIARQSPVAPCVQSAVWWHAQAAILAAQDRTLLGVDAVTLSDYLVRALPSLVS